MLQRVDFDNAHTRLLKLREKYYGEKSWGNLITKISEKFTTEEDQELLKKYSHKKHYKREEEIKSNIENSDKWFKDGNYGKAKTHLDEFIRFEKMVNIIDPPKAQIASNLLSSTLNNTSNTHDLSGKVWYVYFYHLPNNTGRSNALPKLGRAVLKGLPENKVFLDNLKSDGDINAHNYNGDYFVMGFSDTLIFNLYLTKIMINDKGESTTVIKKYLQIRASFKDTDDKIIVGSYNSLDKEGNYHGSIILEKTDNQNAQSKTFCFFENKQELKSEVDWQIRKYLSRKIVNYHMEPRFKTEVEELEVLFDNYSPFKNIEQRFIEPPKPKLFLSTPQSSIDNFQDNQEYIHLIHDELNRNFNNILDIHYDKDWENGSTLENFRSLVNTRFFVLFLNQETKLSMSQMELGFSLSVVKKVIIIAPSELISDRVQSFEDENKTKKPLISLKIIDSTGFDRKEKQEKVLRSLIRYIKLNCKPKKKEKE